ncbi:hypothetical protein C8R44DRAFT_746828 [Mycena epipterygia]|nr:hypothetical protein C8R44DRAFT_746828 [Mycena epipterygia]
MRARAPMRALVRAWGAPLFLFLFFSHHIQGLYVTHSALVFLLQYLEPASRSVKASASHTALAARCHRTRALPSVSTTSSSESVPYRINGKFAKRPTASAQAPPANTALRALERAAPPHQSPSASSPTPRTPEAAEMSDETPAPVPIVVVTTPPSDSEKIDALQAQLTQLLSIMQVAAVASQAAGATPAQPEQPPPLALPPQQQFTAPLAPLNSPAGALPSLRSLFPDIEPACIMAVITHELKATDLYKLDVRVKDAEPSYSLSATGTFEMNVSRHKAYKNWNSVAFPLHNYFAILTAHLPTRLEVFPFKFTGPEYHQASPGIAWESTVAETSRGRADVTA